MRTLMKLCLLASLGTSSLALGDVSSALQAAVSNPNRSAKDKARDEFRHPGDTLSFFGVTTNSNVVEIWPSGGYWTEILAPLLSEKGVYTAAASDRNDGIKKFKANFVGKMDTYGVVRVTRLDPPDEMKIAPDESADFVLTFRNFHNWMKAGQADAVLAAAFKALKKGGILGLEEHRGKDDKPQDPKAELGYVREDYVIAAAKKAGFTFVEKSEVNANPKDTKDYPEGVWTLPPTYRLGEKDRAKYTAIGESDRMTLKFKK